MNIINLRHVGASEIPDSFRGILRISPNDLEDDPSNLLTDTTKEIFLSDSVGNQLPLSFIPKRFSAIVINRKDVINLINLSIKVDKLFVSNELNIKQTLYVELKDDITPPIIFSNNSNAVGYPFESPDDDKYFNLKNKFNFVKSKSWEENVASMPITSDPYKEKNNEQWIKVNGNYLYNDKRPLLKKRDYVLGARLKDKYDKREMVNSIHNISELKYDNEGTYTQLSFLPVETLMFSALESEINNKSRTLEQSRYIKFNAENISSEENTTDNNLAKTKDFNTGTSKYGLTNKVPIMNAGVQSGTIHYNAIPTHRYFFHLIRQYDTNTMKNYIDDKSGTLKNVKTPVSRSINDIVSQYVLCDGKNINSDYPAISKYLLTMNWSDTHDAIRNSIEGKSGSSKTFKTPSLFDCGQTSLRFLKGLNWLYTADESTIYDSTNNVFESKQAINFIPLMKI